MLKLPAISRKLTSMATTVCVFQKLDTANSELFSYIVVAVSIPGVNVIVRAYILYVNIQVMRQYRKCSEACIVYVHSQE